MISSKKTKTPYVWGAKCKGWHLLNTKNLSVIQEIMPPGTEEALHQHIKAQQFFYVLKGRATFKIDHNIIVLAPGEGLHIEVGSIHKIKNEENTDLEFLVISQPHAHDDRINIASE